jgi:hypothetical protein
MDPDAAILHFVPPVKPWGKFEPDDLRNFEQSLRDTITTQLPATVRSTGPRLDVHVMIRRYMVAASNTGGAVLASVTWAATDAEGKLIYQEQFYASEAVSWIWTPGLLKESVNKSIVRRIATTSLELATGPDAEKNRPTTFDNTYKSLEEAVSRLPQVMWSAHPPVFVGPFNVGQRPEVSRVDWMVVKLSQDFDWQGYLGKLYTNHRTASTTTPVSDLAYQPTKAALERRKRETTASIAALSVSVAAPGVSASAYPRRLTGEELVEHVRNAGKVNVMAPMDLVSIAFQRSNTFHIIYRSRNSPAGELQRGTYSFNPDRDQVCLRLIDRSNFVAGSPHSEWMEDCFRVSQTDEKTYSLKTVKGDYSFSYAVR